MNTKNNQLTSIIFDNMIIKGDVSFKGRTIISGKVEGNVTGDDMKVTKTGVIDGDVTLTNLECNGQLTGDIIAKTVLLRATALIKGRIKTNDLRIEQGAVLDCTICKKTTKSDQVKTVVSKEDLKPTQDIDIVFQDNIEQESFFPGGARKVILTGLLTAIDNGKQLIRVYGENGCGKTFICKTLQRKLLESYNIILIDDPIGSIKDILVRIAKALDLPSDSDNEQSDLLNKIKESIQLSKQNQRPVILLLDEADKMYPATLEGILKYLTELYSPNADHIQIILFGLPLLETQINSHAFQLPEELSCRFVLPPLSLKETKDYIDYRIATSNLSNTTKNNYLVQMDTVKKIYTASNGIMSKIDKITIKALEKAYAIQSEEILPKHVANNL